jgi:hypothetical protein
MKRAMRDSILLVAGLTGVPACDRYGPVAPDGATFQLSVDRDTLRGPGDSARVDAAVILETGDLVKYDAVVTFSTTRGGLCAGTLPCPDSLGVPAVAVEASAGVARVSLRSGADTGLAIVKVRSGEAVDSLMIPIVAAVSSP